jgi:hypothetical protein
MASGDGRVTGLGNNARGWAKTDRSSLGAGGDVDNQAGQFAGVVTAEERFSGVEATDPVVFALE